MLVQATEGMNMDEREALRPTSRYVATEDGILEYTVNLDNRKTFPATTLQ